MLIVIAVIIALLFGLAASFLMTRASNFSAAANLSFGALFALGLAIVLLLIVIAGSRILAPP